jgi:hypothetical protein
MRTFGEFSNENVPLRLSSACFMNRAQVNST